MDSKNFSNEKTTPIFIRLVLWLLIGVHVISGAIILSLIFPFAKPEKKHWHIQKWSKHLLAIFGIELAVINQGVLTDNSYLLASNHISWMDIHAINAFRPIRFVAKSEVQRWPIFGWMAKQLGTIFIKRDSSRHAHQVAGILSKVLKKESVCIFPEGTSTLGNDVRPFKPNLFEAAVISGVPVYSLAISYISKATEMRSEVPAFVGDMGLLESMANILKHRNLIVRLTFFPPDASSLEPAYDRKSLALHSYEVIGAHLACAS